MTEVSLKEYIESRLTSIETATRTARESMEKRLEGMNEFRESLKDQSAKFVTKDEFNRSLEDIKALRDFKSNAEGKSSIAIILAMAGLLVAIITIFVK